MCSGCRQRLAQQRAAEAHTRALAAYENDKLPVVSAGNAILKKGETAHYITPTVLEEIKTVNLGYSGGSHGISVPLPIKIGGAPDTVYRVGQSRGHIVKHDELKATSNGELIITNKRIFLNPAAGNKPVSVNLDKIASFHVYENGLEVWQDGKQKPYLFVLNGTASEICGLCLSKLLQS